LRSSIPSRFIPVPEPLDSPPLPTHASFTPLTESLAHSVPFETDADVSVTPVANATRSIHEHPAFNQELSPDARSLLKALRTAHDNESRLQAELASSVDEFAAYRSKADAGREALLAELSRLRNAELTKPKLNVVAVQKGIEDLRRDCQELMTLANAQQSSFHEAMSTFVDRVLAAVPSVDLERIRVERDDAVRARLVAEEALRNESNLRRMLHNEIMQLKGSVRVVCRIRPVSDNERDARLTAVVHGDVQSPTILTLTNPRTGAQSQHDYDVVLGAHTSAESVFSPARDLVVSALDGYCVAIFAYGPTGSGKTFTMAGTPEIPGVNFRALKVLFDLMKMREETHRYQVHLSVIELYNRHVYDLLADPQHVERVKLSVGRDESGVVEVKGAMEVAVESWAAMEQGLWRGMQSRSQNSTAVNERSSRSHCIVRVRISGHCIATGRSYRSRINLVDLAGSENMERSGLSGTRLTESKHINQSLSALGGVFHALSTNRAHIPFRDDKLTYILSDALGGEGKTLVYVCLNPCVTHLAETLNSLQFASRIRTIRQSAKPNTQPRPMSASVS
ncbi:hypothetical protein PBRA_002307, partial [Plasmodiophora brassicae]